MESLRDSPTRGWAESSLRVNLIEERLDLRVQRLTERFAPNIAFFPWARVGGQVVRKSAFRIGSVQA